VWLISDLGSGNFAPSTLRREANRLIASLHLRAETVRVFETTTAIADYHLIAGN
jgi:hypothetical protein